MSRVDLQPKDVHFVTEEVPESGDRSDRGNWAMRSGRRLVLAALLASAGALAPGAGVSRRAVLGQAAAASGAGAVLLAPLLALMARMTPGPLRLLKQQEKLRRLQ